jgi:hypothetical protein
LHTRSTLAIAAFVILFGHSSAWADQDGTVAFGKDFVVFTQYGPHGQTLNVVPVEEPGPLKVAASIDVPISWAMMAVRDRRVFLLWWKSLYIYELKSNWTPELLKTLEVPDHQTVRSISVAGSDLVVHKGPCDLHIDLTQPLAGWRLRPVDAGAKPEPSHWRINDHRDWVPADGTCLPQGDDVTCLVYGTSRYADGAEFTDKFLVKRKVSGPIESTLYIVTLMETFD